MKTTTKFTAITLLIALTAGSTGPVFSQQQNAPNNAAGGDPCNATAAAVGGALLGALLGGKKNRAAGAAAGGIVGAAACVAINYHTKQVKSAQQVNQDFQATNGGALPLHSQAVKYQTRFDPTDKIQPGGSTSLSSYIEVVEGSDGLHPMIEEEISIFGPDGNQLKTLRKAANATASAGAFQSQFQFTMPAGVSQGVYVLKSNLYINGQKSQEAQAQLQVVSNDNMVVLASR